VWCCKSKFLQNGGHNPRQNCRTGSRNASYSYVTVNIAFLVAIRLYLYIYICRDGCWSSLTIISYSFHRYNPILQRKIRPPTIMYVSIHETHICGRRFVVHISGQLIILLVFFLDDGFLVRDIEGKN
jgi:hypothetical protein